MDMLIIRNGIQMIHVSLRIGERIRNILPSEDCW